VSWQSSIKKEMVRRKRAKTFEITGFYMGVLDWRREGTGRTLLP